MGAWNEIHAQAVAESKEKERPKVEHEWHNPCLDRYGDFHTYCQWCDGGLECCKNCGAFEGATPDDCPQEQMSAVFSDRVYEGILNYREGYWRFECAQAMRHIYDIDNYMADAGYIRDGVNAAGNPKWKRVSNEM